MGQLPTNRTSANTVQEHVDDHNEVHRLHNQVDDAAASTGEILEKGVSAWAAVSKAAAGISETGHTHVEVDITNLTHTDATAVHDNVAAEVNAITEKVSPIAADLVIIEDSAAGHAKKKAQVGNLPAASGNDPDAIHDNVSGEIIVVAEKVTPISADVILIEDTAASNAKKRVQIGNLPASAGGDTNTKAFALMTMGG